MRKEELSYTFKKEVKQRKKRTKPDQQDDKKNVERFKEEKRGGID